MDQSGGDEGVQGGGTLVEWVCGWVEEEEGENFEGEGGNAGRFAELSGLAGGLPLWRQEDQQRLQGENIPIINRHIQIPNISTILVQIPQRSTPKLIFISIYHQHNNILDRFWYYKKIKNEPFQVVRAGFHLRYNYDQQKNIEHCYSNQSYICISM